MAAPPLEIERVFLIAAVPDVAACRAWRIRQGYLAIGENGEAARVRLVAEARETNGARATALLTVKRGTGSVREEVEVALTSAQAEALWPMTASRRVEKTRYRVPLGERLEAEVDVFEGALDGLVLVEVEFASLETARAFAPPAWFGEEVTQDARYRNQHLAMRGMPERGDTTTP